MTTERTVSEVRQALLDIATERDGFKVGGPWRYSDASVVAVLPILREVARERAYITLAEAGERVRITEKGSVSRVGIENRGDVAVFLRAGEILAGATQERALVSSQVVEAGEKRDLEVVCVHQSRGLSTGTKFRTGGYTPRPLYQTLHARADQHTVWAGIGHYTATLASYAASHPSSDMAQARFEAVPHDDLVQASQKFSAAIKDILAKVPRVENQVGLATIGLEGVIAFESYDLSQSWSAVREAAVRQQGEDLSKVIEDADQVFQYRPERALEALRSLLTMAFSEERSGGNGTWHSVRLKTRRYIGEATVYLNKVIHLYLVAEG